MQSIATSLPESGAPPAQLDPFEQCAGYVRRLRSLIDVAYGGKASALSEKSGIHIRTLKKHLYLKLLHRIHVETVVRMCERLCIDSNWLLHGTGDPPPCMLHIPQEQTPLAAQATPQPATAPAPPTKVSGIRVKKKSGPAAS